MISISSPTRVDLAGGTLDMWPLYNLTGGAQTVNIAIDIQTHVQLEKNDQCIVIESADLKWKKTYPDRKTMMRDGDPQGLLYRTVLSCFPLTEGFSLKTSSESPVGGGLGGSSSLVISLLKAFHQLMGEAAPSVHAMVHRAHNLESQMLGTPTGTQDYYPAVTGGLSILKYGIDGIVQEVLPFDQNLNERFLLVYTGRSHHSGLNNFEVLKSAVGKEPAVLRALSDLKKISDEMAQVCRTRQWSHLAGLFQQEYQARVRLAPAFTCPEIQQLEKLVMGAGAEAIKICGAGGGGCVMVWCPPKERARISTVCENAGFQVLSARPVQPL